MKRILMLTPFALPFALLTLSACVLAESPSAVMSAHGGGIGVNRHAVKMHDADSVSKFEGIWKEIRTCNVIFYDSEKSESFEDGRVVRYLRTRGYVINDTGMGYLRVERLKETFHGYKVIALTLPDEWGVYGMDIAAEMSQVSNKLFPLIHFEKRISNDGGAALFATLDAGSDTKPAVFLTLESSKINGYPLTTVTCRIEYGN